MPKSTQEMLSTMRSRLTMAISAYGDSREDELDDLRFLAGSSDNNWQWPVANGYFTENTPNRFWLAFSNPRRNSGYFYETFNSKRDFWATETVDARDVESTDKAVYQQIIDEYGAESTQARVEVYGMFPDVSDDQFISVVSVEDAMKRQPIKDEGAPVILGVDPARYGADSTVIAVRQGRDVIAIKRYRDQDTMETVGRVIEMMDEHSPHGWPVNFTRK